MTAHELYQAGQLTAALAAATQDVQQHPTDTARRGLLFELLCFAGQWQRTDLHLETIGQQEPQALAGISMLRQLVRAEIARQQFYTEGRLPEFLVEPPAYVQRHLEASICVRQGELGEAAQILAQAEQQRPPCRGLCDGQAFDDLRDLDDLTSPLFEVLTTTGKYYWIPVESVETLELHPPQRPRDLLWRRARMVVRNGPDGEVFLPTLYFGTHSSGADSLRLGRSTEWTGGDGQPVRGLGLRMFLVGDQDQSILEIHQIEFQAVQGAAGGADQP